MQLHACLLLFIITTDKTLALLHQRCGGNVSLDQQPAGHINLTTPGLFTDTDRLNPMNRQSDETISVRVCSWMIGVPPGRTVFFSLAWLESGSSVSVRCVWNEEDQVLESGVVALLSGCDGNKATLTWKGAGHSSNAIQLSYNVQEDERNSSEDHTSPHSDRDLSRTGTSFTRTAPVGQEVVRGTEEGRGRLREGLERSSGPQSASSPSSQDQGLLSPTSPLQGLTVAGRADRETLPLPEEEPNNRADTSGRAHRADDPMSPRERTHPYFHLSTDTLLHTLHTANTETNSNKELPQTQMDLTHATVSNSNTMLGSEMRKYTVTQTPTATKAHPTVSSSSAPPLTSSPPELPSWTTWESDTILSTHGGAVSQAPRDKVPHFWRSQRSTDRINSDLTSAVTSDTLQSATKSLQDDSSSANTDTDPTASSSSSSSPSSSSSQGLSRTPSSTALITELHTAVERNKH
ncbi:uncharacterized protein [Pempheris klunzingeri]|uniref:uncharacterized protein n=1 Tax=Pempheris klunzingeri TaxID=3127111 RepID=UPI00397F0204